MGFQTARDQQQETDNECNVAEAGILHRGNLKRLFRAIQLLPLH